MWKILRRRKRNIFLSHSCADHVLANEIRNELVIAGYTVTLDPFEPGDKTCDKVQESIKEATHFILLLTRNALSSYWVRIEALFAQQCYKRGAICFLPVSVDERYDFEPADELIHIEWERSDGVEKLVTSLAKRIANSFPSAKLKTEVVQSKTLVEEGRVFERKQANTNDILFLHQAVRSYEQAIMLDFCNHNAWANLAWSLWKLREDNVARKYIKIAEDISPYSNHVKDVKERIRLGKRTIL